QSEPFLNSATDGVGTPPSTQNKGTSMTHPTNKPADASDREIIITPVFDAPRELVFQAWTSPDHIASWWGPNGFTTTTEVMEFRAGGSWKHVMHGPDGRNYPNDKVYLEIVPPERIVFTNRGGEDGGPQIEFRSTVTFEDLGGKTRLTLRSMFPTTEMRDY